MSTPPAPRPGWPTAPRAGSPKCWRGEAPTPAWGCVRRSTAAPRVPAAPPAQGGRPARIHPVVDLCNAVSVAYAVPVAVLDTVRITGPLLEVRPARGDEEYTTFDGRTEHPAPAR
ncbi:phenylalanine--tRNA ligase beta subunit-related protein [Streptomyces thermocarboxydus]